MLQRTYNVRDEDIVEIQNATEKVCSDTYSQFSEKLQKSSGKRILVFHVFSGHGVLKDRNQSMLINRFDPQSRFYERFEAEKWIKKIAQECPNTYNIGIFGSHRDPEKKEYNLFNHDLAQK